MNYQCPLVYFKQDYLKSPKLVAKSMIKLPESLVKSYKKAPAMKSLLWLSNYTKKNYILFPFKYCEYF